MGPMRFDVIRKFYCKTSVTEICILQTLSQEIVCGVFLIS